MLVRYRNYSVSRLGAVFGKSLEFKAGVEFLAWGENVSFSRIPLPA